MSGTGAHDISNTNRINYLNIVLMLISAVLAFAVPFELFLFAYAVLGPAHYLTEISWLHEKKYFTKREYDFVLLGLLAIALFVSSFAGKPLSMQDQAGIVTLTNGIIFLAFFSSLIFFLIEDTTYRVIAAVAIITLTYFLRDFHSSVAGGHVYIFLSVFLPTLLHVYVFTGCFILYGALKGRSKSGYFSFLVFLLCPLLFICIRAGAAPISQYVHDTYQSSFYVVNSYLLQYFTPASFLRTEVTLDDIIYKSQEGLMAMRFIAFAYTYHYLNWFSKIKIIKWHKVSPARLVVIAILWVIAVACYAWSYELGFKVLFCLSFMHVFLEFPLNHLSILGTFRELRGIGQNPASHALRS